MLKPSAVPSVFDFNKGNGGGQCVETPRSKRQRLRESRQPPSTSLRDVTLDDDIDIQHEVEISTDSEYISVNNAEQEAPEYKEPVHKEVQCSMQILGTFSIEHFQTNNRMVQYYTGFNNYSHFQLFFNILGPAVYELKYNCHLLTPENQLFLTLMKLKQAKEDVELALFFGISESTVSIVVRTWINFLFFQLKELDAYIWPSVEIVQQHMPADFAKKFPKTRVILDATEQPIQKPSDLEAQSATWSSYKHKNTLKTMVGITPSGAVSFVSGSYGGSTSDRQIIERSSLVDPNLSLFSKGDSIMADRGIMVQDLFANHNVQVNTPTFLKGKSQLDPTEVVHDRRVASKRIHVERVIGYVKGFKILKVDLPSSKVPLGSRISYVCFALANFRSCIVDKSA